MSASTSSKGRPRSTVGRGSAEGRRRLTRSEIINTALEALDRGTLGELSMRGLADQLGVTPMALYLHVADKDDILDEVLNVALRRDAAPPRAPRQPASWRPWMVRLSNSLRAVLTQHPALLDRYLRAPVAVPAALERMEAALAVLGAAGFSDSEATEVYASVHTFTLGFAALEVFRARPQQPRRGRQTHSSKGARSWPAYFAALSDSDYPNLTRIQPDLAAFTSSVRFPKAIGRLLAGWNPRAKGPRRARMPAKQTPPPDPA